MADILEIAQQMMDDHKKITSRRRKKAIEEANINKVLASCFDYYHLNRQEKCIQVPPQLQEWLI